MCRHRTEECDNRQEKGVDKVRCQLKKSGHAKWQEEGERERNGHLEMGEEVQWVESFLKNFLKKRNMTHAPSSFQIPLHHCQWRGKGEKRSDGGVRPQREWVEGQGGHFCQLGDQRLQGAMREERGAGEEGREWYHPLGQPVL